MQMLSRATIRLVSQIFCIIIICIAKTEQRAVARIRDSSTAIVEETATMEDEALKGFDLLKSVSFFRTSIPMRIYECLSTQSLMRCMKIYILQKMEANKQYPRTGNLTRDFLDKFISDEPETSNLLTEQYTQLNDEELNKRLIISFQQFFNNSNIKMHFLPGITVKIIPSKDSKLKFSLKRKLKHVGEFTGRTLESKDENIDSASNEPLPHAVEGPVGEAKNPASKGHAKKRKNKKDIFSYKNTIIQMAVPVMVMPAILLGTIIPFLLPVLKMATIMSLLMNNSAFIAALIYAARTHANSQDEQHISYGNHPIYH